MRRIRLVHPVFVTIVCIVIVEVDFHKGTCNCNGPEQTDFAKI